MEFIAKKFSELTVWELYEILKSRSEIFMLEQNIICLDMDDRDKECLHCFFFDGNRVTAYLRAFKTGADEVTVGRVLTLEHGNGLGKKLMIQSIEEIKKHFGCKKICLHSQKKAVGFYIKMGFEVVSDEYLEAGIIHLTMEKHI